MRRDDCRLLARCQCFFKPGILADELQCIGIQHQRYGFSQPGSEEFCGLRRAPQAGTDDGTVGINLIVQVRSEEHTSELQSLMRSSYAVFCLKKKKGSTKNKKPTNQC